MIIIVGPDHSSDVFVCR